MKPIFFIALTAVLLVNSVTAQDQEATKQLVQAITASNGDFSEDSSLVMKAIAKGADVNAKNYGTLIWMTALTMGSLQIAQILIDHGARVNIKIDGSTPLHSIAQSRSSLPAVKLLCQAGADWNAYDDDHETPLSMACMAGQYENAEFFIKKGANVKTKNRLGYTPLHWATLHMQYSIMKLLIASGAEVNAKDNEGQTPLDVAVAYKDQHNDPEIINLLHKYGAKTGRDLK